MREYFKSAFRITGVLHFECELSNIKSHRLTNVNFLLKTLSSLLLLITDYVYFENSSSNPYLIRRIEELNKVYTECS